MERFTFSQFSTTECFSMDRVMHKCWADEYDSVDTIFQDLRFVHESDGHRCRENNVLEKQVTHYVFEREKRALLITEQTSLTSPEDYFTERLVRKSHDEAAQIKTADSSITLF